MPGDKIVGWKSIARELGLSESRLRHWIRAAGIILPKLGPGQRSPVYIVRGQLYLAVQYGVKAALEHSRTA